MIFCFSWRMIVCAYLNCSLGMSIIFIVWVENSFESVHVCTCVCVCETICLKQLMTRCQCSHFSGCLYKMEETFGAAVPLQHCDASTGVRGFYRLYKRKPLTLAQVDWLSTFVCWGTSLTLASTGENLPQRLVSTLGLLGLC